MTRKRVAQSIIVMLLLFLLIRVFTSRPSQPIHIKGTTMGSIAYNVKYMDDKEDYQLQIDSILTWFNQSLSTYISDSEISLVNTQYELKKPGKMMLEVLRKSEEVWIITFGAFDPTIGPLVNAWGFGPNKKPTLPDSAIVDSLLQYVGFGKVLFSDSIVQIDPGMYLDFSAIAKGYAVDLVAGFLETKGIENFMVEIGGEVRVKGNNEQGNPWRIGIEDPLVKMNEKELLGIISFTNRSMATSGDYRNYYELDGKTIAHTIDPRSGYSMENDMLSATVFADDCMTADAFATAFMVLGFGPSMEILKQTGMEAILVYYEQDELNVFISPDLKQNTELIKSFNQSSGQL